MDPVSFLTDAVLAGAKKVIQDNTSEAIKFSYYKLLSLLKKSNDPNNEATNKILDDLKKGENSTQESDLKQFIRDSIKNLNSTTIDEIKECANTLQQNINNTIIQNGKNNVIQIGGQGKQEVTYINHATQTTPPPKGFNLQISNKFIGRESEFNELNNQYQIFKGGDCGCYALITGAPGTGRSTLAEYFAIKLADEVNKYKIDLGFKPISEAFLGIKSYINMPNTNDSEPAKSEILNEIPDNSVLVFSNASIIDKESINFFNQRKLFIIITGNPSPKITSTNFTCSLEISLDQFSEKECIEYIDRNLESVVAMSLKDQNIFSKNIQLCNPLCLSVFCKLISEQSKHWNESDFSEEIDKVIKTLSEETDILKGLCIQAFKDIKETSSEPLLYAASIFQTDLIRESALLEVAGEPVTSQDFKRCLEYGFFALVNQNEFTLDPHTNSKEIRIYQIHSIHKQYLIKQFEGMNNEKKRAFIHRFVTYWMGKQGSAYILENRHNYIHAVELWLDLGSDGQSIFESVSLDGSFVAFVEVVLSPVLRKTLFFRLLDDLNVKSRHIVYYGIAGSFLRQGMFIDAEMFAQAGIRFCAENNTNYLLPNLYRRLSTIYRSMDNIKKARQCCEKCIDLLPQNNSYLFDARRQLAKIQEIAGELIAAEQQITENINLLINQRPSVPGSENTLAYCLTTKGNILKKLGRYKEANNYFQAALSTHKKKMGDSHYYVAYDKQLIARNYLNIPNRQTEGVALAKEAYQIYHNLQMNPSTALSCVTISELYLSLKKPKEALYWINKAIDLYLEKMGKETKYLANAYRVCCEIYLVQNDKEKIKEQIKKLLESKKNNAKNTAMYCKIELTEAKVNIFLQRTDGYKLLWRVYKRALTQKYCELIEGIEKELVSSLLLGGRDWDDSAKYYKEHLDKYPENIHNSLANAIAQEISRENCDSSKKPVILDLFTGTGLMLNKIKNILPNAQIVACDGSQSMMEIASQSRSESDTSFIKLPEQFNQIQLHKFDYIVCNMSIFQLDLRARIILFNYLMRYMTENGKLIISTYAADFSFPKEILDEFPQANSINAFKGKLLEKLSKIDSRFRKVTLDTMVASVFPKENINGIRYFMEILGLKLQEINTSKTIPIVTAKRSYNEFLEFSKIPVISRKVFGKKVPKDSSWRKLFDEYGSNIQTVYGTRLSGSYCGKRIPLSVFSHDNFDPKESISFRYAIAIVIQNKGKTLFLKRGKNARDFVDSWSLPSTFAREDMSLEESIKLTLKKNLDFQKGDFSSFIPLSVRFNKRGVTEGSPWIMVMCLYMVTTDKKELTISEKYSQYSWEDGEEFLKTLKNDKMGDCTKSFRDILTMGRLPGRKAAAIAIHNSQGQVLIFKRSDEVDEFKGVWSLPSVFVEEDEDATVKIKQKIDEWASIKLGTANPKVERECQRPTWKLNLTLFEGSSDHTPTLNTNKYTEFKYVDGLEFFSSFNYENLGDCAKAYLEYYQVNKRLIGNLIQRNNSEFIEAVE